MRVLIFLLVGLALLLALVGPVRDELRHDWRLTATSDVRLIYAAIGRNQERLTPRDRLIWRIETVGDDWTLRRAEQLLAKVGDDPVVLGFLLADWSWRLPGWNRVKPASGARPITTDERRVYEAFAQAARRGRVLQPQNTFWDWMLLRGLLALERDDEARAVLREAARKPRLDDFWRERVAFYERAVRVVYGKPTAFERYQTFFAGGRMSWASAARDVGRGVRERIRTQARAGQNEAALGWGLDLVRLCRTTRCDGDLAITQIMANTVERMALFPFDPPRGRRRTVAQWNTLTSEQVARRPESLAFLARRIEDRKAERELAAEWPEIVRSTRWLDSVSDLRIANMGVQFEAAGAGRSVVHLESARRAVLRTGAVVGALFLLLAGVASCGARTTRSFEKTVLRPHTARGALSALLGLLIMAAVDVLLVSDVFVPWWQNGTLLLLDRIWFLLPVWGFALVPLVVVSGGLSRANPEAHQARFEWRANRDFWEWFALGLRFSLALSLGALLIGFLLALSWGWNHPRFGAEVRAASEPLPSALVLGVAFVVLLVFRRASLPRGIARWRYVLTASLGGATALLLALYLILKIVSWPVETRSEVRWRSFVARGDVVVLKALRSES